jgi:DNA segregation ATPase FtsK/SpoIIIE-like protein
MRMSAIGALTLGLLMTGPAQADPIPKNADEAVQLQMEAVGDRWPDRWQGRQHYLFDEEALPTASTDGRNAADSRACVAQSVRVRQPDGSTSIARVNRCE